MIDRIIQKKVTVAAPVEDVWQAWTTPEGVLTFFAPKANVELAIGGRYEMLFNLDAPPGSQGGEGLKILSYLPQEMLSFDWNAPPKFPNVRQERSWVVVQFEAQPANTSRVKLTHLGWQAGTEWEQVFEYFTRTWDVVLERLEYSFSTGPLDWADPDRPI